MTARPTTYKGIRMRSRLEAGYAAWLDRVGFDWGYEVQCYAGPGGQWLPDFTIHQVYDVFTRTLRTAHVEVKPKLERQCLDEYHRRAAGVPADDLVLMQAEKGLGRTSVAIRDRDGRTAGGYPAPTMTCRRRDASSCGWVLGRWVAIDAGPGFPAAVLASSLDVADMPWPDEWWKGTAA